MNTERFLHYDTEDFVLDDGFQKWILKPDRENDPEWIDFFNTCSEQHKITVKEAILIIKAFQPVEPESPVFRSNQILHVSKPATGSFRRISIKGFKYAAIFLLFCLIGGIAYYYSLQNKEVYTFKPVSQEISETGKIVLADGTIHEFDTEKTIISQTSAGEVTVNNETVPVNVSNLKEAKEVMSQVIIPYGKRSEITLSDGTRIWLNSGSNLSYPPVFNGDTREVYLTGEAFFDVQTDPSKPFFVVTNDIRLKVLGTRFNVSSYENDPITHAVLLEGSVSVGRNKVLTRNVELIPGERIVYDRSDASIVKQKVNVYQYSSWINGYLIFERESLSEIFKKLERYYNKVIFVEKGFENITYSGKLDLAEDIEEVLENISYTSSFTVDKNSEGLIIRKDENLKKNL